MAVTHLERGTLFATLTLDHAGGNRINLEMRVELKETVQRMVGSH